MASSTTKLNEETIKDIDKKETFSSATNELNYHIQELRSQMELKQSKIIELKDKVEILENDLQEKIKYHNELLTNKWDEELVSLCTEQSISIGLKLSDIDSLKNLDKKELEAQTYSLSASIADLTPKSHALLQNLLSLNCKISHLSVEKKSLENKKNALKSSNINSQESSYERFLTRLQEKDITINELDKYLSELENKLKIQTSDNNCLLKKVQDSKERKDSSLKKLTELKSLAAKNLDKLNPLNLDKGEDADKLSIIKIFMERSSEVFLLEHTNIKQQENVDLLQKKVDQLIDENKTLSDEIEQMNTTLINPNHENTTHSTFDSFCILM